MKASNQSLISLISLLIIAIAVNLAHARGTDQNDRWEENDTTLVGRIAHLEGSLTRYDPERDDWEETSQEAPFGIDDLLYAGADTRAEILMPNNTWIRIGETTRLQLITLVPVKTKVDISMGTARMFNKSSKTKFRATTPFGVITVPPGAIVDFTVDDTGVQIAAIRNKAYFKHNRSMSRYEIRSDSSAMFADLDTVSPAAIEMDYSWKQWNRDMDARWTARLRSKSASSTYLPDALRYEAYPLDRHGVWERVYYEGAYYRFWRPVRVHSGWAPFTAGVWTIWHGDHVWIPHDPFGYVTHHYGNWIFTAGIWYWAPPVTRVTIRLHRPLLRIGFGWYPGRVAWIHHGAHLGWIPLAPREPYYTHRRWGRRCIVVNKGARYRHRPHRYRHHNHAVVIHRNHLYRSGNYRNVSVRNVSRASIRRNFRTTPVINKAVIKDLRTVKRRHTGQRRIFGPRDYKYTTQSKRGRTTERIKAPTRREQRHGRKENRRLHRQGVGRKVDAPPKKLQKRSGTSQRRPVHSNQRTTRSRHKEIKAAGQQKSKPRPAMRSNPTQHRSGKIRHRSGDASHRQAIKKNRVSRSSGGRKQSIKPSGRYKSGRSRDMRQRQHRQQ